MTNKELKLLNHQAIAQIISERGYKLWWVAEQLNINERTLSRWINKKIKRISSANIKILSTFFNVPQEYFIRYEEPEELASATQLTQLATLLENHRVAEIMLEMGRYDLLTEILKTSIHSNMPLPLLGRIYCDLCQGYFQRSLFSECKKYARKAIVIGEKVDDIDIVIHGTYYLALVHNHVYCDLASSTKMLKFCLERKKDLRNKSLIVQLHMNVGLAMAHYGNFKDGIIHLKWALNRYAKNDDNLGCYHCFLRLGTIYIELRKWSKASACLSAALKHVKKTNFRIGPDIAISFMIWVKAEQGELSTAKSLLRKIRTDSLPENFYCWILSEAVLYLRQGQEELAEKLILRYLQKCAKYYLYDKIHGYLYLIELYKKKKNSRQVSNIRKKMKDVLTHCHCLPEKFQLFNKS